jgi:Arc/MetJ family transcription regulator
MASAPAAACRAQVTPRKPEKETHALHEEEMLNEALHWRSDMRTTINLDDHLLAQAKDLIGVKEKSALVNEALTALIQRESARRLAKLGGSRPDLQVPPRRRLTTGDEI